MIKTQHPWQVGPTELIEFALERMHKGSDFDRRLAFLILDLGVETLFKTYLKLPESIMQFQIKRAERLEASEGNFHDLLRGIQKSNPQKANKFIFGHIEHYHNIRNLLYHQGNQAMAVPLNQLEGYAKLSVELLREYLEVDLSKNLKPPVSVPKVVGDPLIDSIEVELSIGRFRIERRKSQSIYVYSSNNNTPLNPVKPFLRKVINELSLPVTLNLKTGSEKNTRFLGKDVIKILKASDVK